MPQGRLEDCAYRASDADVKNAAVSCRVPDADCGMQGARRGQSEADCQKLVAGCRLPEAGCQKQAAKGWLSEAGRQRLRGADGNEPVISRERKKCMTMYEEELN